MRVERMKHGRGPFAAWIMGLCLVASSVLAADPALSVSQAWTPAAVPGGDTPVYLVVRNTGPADALVRVRCSAANFSELNTIDRGEGFPSRRAVKAIPIPGEATTVLEPDGYSVMLLQTTRVLAPSDVFDCVMRFRDGGQQTVNVSVR